MNRERYSTFNDPGTIDSAEAYQVTHNVKVVFQNLLNNFFDSRQTDFSKRDNTLSKFTIKDQFVAKPNDKPPIHIVREFPFKNRNYPFIVVSVPTKKERKMYLGWDNITSIKALEANGIKVQEITEQQHWDMEVNMLVAAKGVDDRDFLVDAISYGFQGYFRSNYIWEHPDTMSTLILHVSSQPIDTELGQSVTQDQAGGELYPVNTGSITIKMLVEHYYRIIEHSPGYQVEMQGTVLGSNPNQVAEQNNTEFYIE